MSLKELKRKIKFIISYKTKRSPFDIALKFPVIFFFFFLPSDVSKWFKCPWWWVIMLPSAGAFMSFECIKFQFIGILC